MSNRRPGGSAIQWAMARGMFRAAILGAIALAAGGPVRAVDEPAASVPLAVVLTDSRGQLLRNPSPNDIEISENGVSRPIASISPRSATPRVIGIMLDEFHVSAGEPTERVRAELRHFIDAHLKSDDVVFVLKPLDSQTTIAAVSSIDALRERVATFAGRKGDYAPRTDFEREYISTSPAMAARQRAQIVRSGLEALAVAMRDSRDAAKALLVFTEGFAAEQRDRVRAMTLRSTARAASLSNIPVYVLDPSGEAPGDRPFNDTWKALTAQTGGALLSGVADLRAPLARIGADLGAQFVLRFESSGKQDGGFHGLELKPRRAGAVLRAPTGYWAPFPASRVPDSRTKFANLLTPHITGLVQPWFRMSPGTDGRTRVTFLWSPRPQRNPIRIEFAALTFEGATVHEAVVASATGRTAGEAEETSFEVMPGPLQVSLAISDAGRKWLGREVRYIDVPAFDPARPVIAAVEFIRPRSLPEFTTLQAREDAVPTAAREFLRQDRLLLRVRAFAGAVPADVQVHLLNRSGHMLMDLPQLASIGGAAQFSLPLARYARGEYRLLVRATGAGQSTTQLLPLHLIG
jgi:VWFA-related protein